MKRHSNFIGAPNKRAKTNQDVEELWGDDLDFDDSVIDDCFTLATQVIENVPPKLTPPLFSHRSFPEKRHFHPTKQCVNLTLLQCLQRAKESILFDTK